jgi:hypothetical protein
MRRSSILTTRGKKVTPPKALGGGTEVSKGSAADDVAVEVDEPAPCALDVVAGAAVAWVLDEVLYTISGLVVVLVLELLLKTAWLLF